MTAFITLSHADSVQQGLHPHISRAEVIAMVGGADLRREIDELSAIRHAAANDDDDDDEDDDDVPPRRAHGTAGDGDDSDDDANEVDDLINIVDVAMYSGMTEPY